MDYTAYKVGSKAPELAALEEGTYFVIDKSGPLWLMVYDRPTFAEINSMSAGHRLEVRMAVINGLLWVLVKCDGQPWMEAPYHPGFGRSPELAPISGDEAGYMLMMVMVDRATKTVAHIRGVGLGHSFSIELRNALAELRKRRIDDVEYTLAVARTQKRYATDTLAEACAVRWVLEEKRC